jgi:hypothetical protein
MTLCPAAPQCTIGGMSDATLVLLAFLALGVGTLLWAIHEINRELPNEQSDDSSDGGAGFP